MRSPYNASAWPKVHHNPQNQQSTDVFGIQPHQDVKLQSMFDDRLKFTLGVYTDSTGALWGTSSSHVFKVAEKDGKYEVIDAIRKPFELSLNDVFHGIYGFVDRDDIYYTYAVNEIYSFASEYEDDPYSPIYMKQRFIFDSGDEDRIMNLGMDFDSDALIFTTEFGRVGALDVDSGATLDLIQLNGNVSNAIAQTRDGHLIILTDTGINKVELKDNKFKIEWSRAYSTADDFVARPSGSGSGTSPSIMVHDDKEYVVIADGMTQQSVMVYDIMNGHLMGTAPVEFPGDAESYTEQSIAVRDNRFVVVQNSYSWVANRVSQLLEAWNVPENAQSMPLLNSRIRENSRLAPVLMGDANLGGFIQFEFDPTKPEGDRLYKTWTSERSCPNAIPVVDGSDGLYCVGKVDTLSPSEPAAGFGGSWAMERQNWTTGKLEATYQLGWNINFNSSYAATQIIGEGKMVYGSFGGLVFVSAV